MTGGRFIIESPTRGVFRDWLDSGKPGFSWSGARDDPDKSWLFGSLAEAQSMLAKFPNGLRGKCQIRSEAEGWAVAGSTEYRYMVRGSLYEPGADGANSDGYIIFYDVYIARSEAEAIEKAGQDYGDYMNIKVHGVAKTRQDESRWLARNPA